MKRLRIVGVFTYDDVIMHGNDPEAEKWFRETLVGDTIIMWETGDIGDEIGSLKITSISEESCE